MRILRVRLSGEGSARRINEAREPLNLPQPEVAFIRPKAGPTDTSYRA